MATKEYFNKLQELSQQYKLTLQNNIENNEKEQQSTQKDIDNTKNLIKQLELISERPEWPDSFIPVNSIAYIPATIVHTSEYYVKLGGENYTFMSLKEVLNYLERKINNKEQILTAIREQYKQLEERYNTVSSNQIEYATETKNMPVEIVSEEGTAYKTASGLYEIIEPYIEDKEEKFYKKRKQNKSQKMVDKDSNSLTKLEQLENVENHNNLILERRVRAILEKSNVYEQLLNDDVINNYCDDFEVKPAQTEALLNDLIIRALLIEPTVYKASDI